MRSIEAHLLLTVVVFVAGLNLVVTKAALQEFEPFTYAILRFGVAAAVMATIARFHHRGVYVKRPDLPLLLLAALCGIALNQLGFMTALSQMNASLVALFLGTIPLFTTATAAVMRNRMPERRFWLAIPLGLLGIWFVAGPVGSGWTITWLGTLAALGAAATWGAYTVMARSLIRSYAIYPVSAGLLLSGTLMLLPFAVPSLIRMNPAAISIGGWMALLYSALIAVIVVQLLYFKAMRSLGAANASLFLYAQPFVGVLLALLLLGEAVVVQQWIGGVLVVSSVVLGLPRQSRSASLPVPS